MDLAGSAADQIAHAHYGGTHVQRLGGAGVWFAGAAGTSTETSMNAEACAARCGARQY
jgi:hypothetical protein